MKSSAPNPVRKKGSHRRRFALYVAIGLLMLGVAFAGHLFFGPDSQIVQRDHQRPANVVTHVVRATTPTQPASPPTPATFTAAELAVMGADMQAISSQVNAVLGKTPLQSGTLTTSTGGLDPTLATHNALSTTINRLLPSNSRSIPNVFGGE